MHRNPPLFSLVNCTKYQIEFKSALKWGTGHNSFLEKATTEVKPIVSLAKPSEESNEKSPKSLDDSENVVLCVLSEYDRL